jgi:hypothetical protein
MLESIKGANLALRFLLDPPPFRRLVSWSAREPAPPRGRRLLLAPGSCYLRRKIA